VERVLSKIAIVARSTITPGAMREIRDTNGSE